MSDVSMYKQGMFVFVDQIGADRSSFKKYGHGSCGKLPITCDSLLEKREYLQLNICHLLVFLI